MLGTKVIEEKTSKFNGNLRVVRSLGMGTYIQSGGLTQSGGVVETIWKQTLRKIPNSKFQTPNCLILGLGGGTVAKLIRKKWQSAKITGVDIDPKIVELGKKYLGLSKQNLKIEIADVREYLFRVAGSNPKSYDLIIVDLYNGDQFPKEFESKNYIHLMRTVLKGGGMIIFNRLYYGDKRPMAVRFGRKLEKIFNEVSWFYPEANLMFICK